MHLFFKISQNSGERLNSRSHDNNNVLFIEYMVRLASKIYFESYNNKILVY